MYISLDTNIINRSSILRSKFQIHCELMASVSKKRKVDLENRVFKESWTEQYYFIMQGKLPTCLLCAVSIAVIKESNLKRHYQTKHSGNFDFLTGAARKSKIESLQRSLTEQQSKFLQHTSELKNTTRASFAVSELIGNRMKPFTDGEFVKECLLTVVDILCPDKRDIFGKISLFARTVTRRIEDLSSDIRTTLQERAQKFEFYAIALDESTDATDIAQVAIFVRGINATFDITEELAGLVSLKDTTTGENIFQGIMSVIGSLGLNLSNIFTPTM